MLECVGEIAFDLKHKTDRHSKRLLASKLELFLHYGVRFYNRQLRISNLVNTGVLQKFEWLLTACFSSNKPQHTDIPMAGYFAKQLHLSGNYCGDLVKKESGKTA